MDAEALDSAGIGPRIGDGVVVLRPMELSDVAAHLAGEDDESVRWLNEGCRSELGRTMEWVAQNRVSWVSGGPVRSFAVCDRVTGALLGTAEANLDWARLGLAAGEVNVSYQVYPAARGRGVAGRAVALLVRYLAGVDEARRAVAFVDPRNVASQRVVEKAGFVFEGDVVHAGLVMRRYSAALRPPGPTSRT